MAGIGWKEILVLVVVALAIVFIVRMREKS